MLPNASKITLIRQTINNGIIPTIITATPGINHSRSANEEYHKLKQNSHFIKEILDCHDAYNELNKMFDDEHKLKLMTLCDWNKPANGTRFPIFNEKGEYIWLRKYDTHQYLWDQKVVIVETDDLLKGRDPVYTESGEWEDPLITVTWADYQNGIWKDVQVSRDYTRWRALYIKYGLVPKCISNLCFSAPTKTKNCIAINAYCGTCHNKIPWTFLVKELNKSHCAGAVEYSKICGHPDAVTSFNNVAQRKPEIVKAGNVLSPFLTHQQELKTDAKDNDDDRQDIIFGSAQNTFTNYDQNKKIIQSYKSKKHIRHEIPSLSIQYLIEDELINDLRYLGLNREDIQLSQLDCLSVVHGVQTQYPVKMYQYHYTSFYLYEPQIDFFIDGGGGMCKYVSMGLKGKLASPQEPRYKLSPIKIAIAAPVGKAQPHTLMTIYTTSPNGQELGLGLKHYNDTYYKFFGKKYDPKHIVFFHMDCFHGTSNAVNKEYNGVESAVYLDDAWKYILKIVDYLKHKHRSVWCHPHMVGAHSKKETKDIKGKDEVFKHGFGKFCYKFMFFMKNCLSTYEIAFTYNVWLWILTVADFTVDKNGISYAKDDYKIIDVKALYKRMTKVMQKEESLEHDETQIIKDKMSQLQQLAQAKELRSNLMKEEIFCSERKENNDAIIINDKFCVSLFPKDFIEA
eukprot:340710_1